MPESETIKSERLPVTKDKIKKDLLSLGLLPGMTVIVHSSLKSIGWVCGTEVAVIDALMDTLTEAGTLIMPTHCSEYSDPANWCNPPVPKQWVEIIRNEMPPFRPEVTPARHMGVIPETFRKYPKTLRSTHPQVSFCAWGKNADFVTGNHSLDYSMGENSPLARIYDLDGYVLLLGTDYDSNTSIHLAEHRTKCRGIVTCGAPVLENGVRVWKNYQDIDYNEEYFKIIGNDFEKKHSVNLGYIGYAESRLIKQRELVDYSVDWFLNNYH